MSDMFDVSFDRVIGHEGNYQDHPADRGNWTTGQIGRGECRGTKFGISAMSYPDLDIENLTVEEAKAIYRSDWWERFHMDRFPQAIRFQMFDAAINHGMWYATRMLQRAAGAADDGVIGPKTRLAIAKADTDDLLLVFLAERLEFMTRITSWIHYGKGWARRIAKNLKLGALDNE